MVHDVDAAIGNGTDDDPALDAVEHSSRDAESARGDSAGSQLPDGTRQISASGPYYRGPGASAAGPPHHYVFELYALDSTIDVPAVGQSPPLTRAAVMTAMAGTSGARRRTWGCSSDSRSRSAGAKSVREARSAAFRSAAGAKCKLEARASRTSDSAQTPHDSALRTSHDSDSGLRTSHSALRTSDSSFYPMSRRADVNTCGARRSSIVSQCSPRPRL